MSEKETRPPLTATEILKVNKEVNDALNKKWDGVRRSFLDWVKTILLDLEKGKRE